MSVDVRGYQEPPDVGHLGRAYEIFRGEIFAGLKIPMRSECVLVSRSCLDDHLSLDLVK